MQKIVMGIFPRREDANDALSELKTEGFPTKEISVIAREDIVNEYSANKNAGEGVAVGSILGGLAGLLAVAAPVAIPGVGIVIAGPLTVFTGLALGTLTGGLIGALVDLGLSNEQARNYEARVKRGGVLVTVNVTDEKAAEQARKIMRHHKAEELVAIPYTGHGEIGTNMHA